MDASVLVAFFTTPAGIAVKTLLVGTFIVFVLGVLAAARDGTFQWKLIDSFVRSTLWGRVIPILTVLLTGYVANEQLLTDGGIAAAAVVAAGMLSTAMDSLKQLTMTKTQSAVVNTLPS